VQQFDIERLKRLIEEIKLCGKALKVEKIVELLSMDCWITHYQDKKTKCVVLPEFRKFTSANSLKCKPVLLSTLHITKILFTHLGEHNILVV
jgi:hypothetical protein